MDALADRAELIELLGRYADIADLKEFTELPGLVLADIQLAITTPQP